MFRTCRGVGLGARWGVGVGGWKTILVGDEETCRFSADDLSCVSLRLPQSGEPAVSQCTLNAACSNRGRVCVCLFGAWGVRGVEGAVGNGAGGWKSHPVNTNTHTLNSSCRWVTQPVTCCSDVTNGVYLHAENIRLPADVTWDADTFQAEEWKWWLSGSLLDFITGLRGKFSTALLSRCVSLTTGIARNLNIAIEKLRSSGKTFSGVLIYSYIFMYWLTWPIHWPVKMVRDVWAEEITL